MLYRSPDSLIRAIFVAVLFLNAFRIRFLVVITINGIFDVFRTCSYQSNSGSHKAVNKDAFCHFIMTTYAVRVSNPKYLVTMDKTAIYLSCAPKRTMHHKERRLCLYSSEAIAQCASQSRLLWQQFET